MIIPVNLVKYIRQPFEKGRAFLTTYLGMASNGDRTTIVLLTNCNAYFKIELKVKYMCIVYL